MLFIRKHVESLKYNIRVFGIIGLDIELWVAFSKTCSSVEMHRAKYFIFFV